MVNWRLIPLAITLSMLLLILLGPQLAPYAIDDVQNMPFAPPQPGWPLGTDYLGADVLSRVLTGGRDLLLLGIAAVLTAWLLSASLAMLAALRGGGFDMLMLRCADVLLSIPGLLQLTLVIVVSGPGYTGAALAAMLIMLPDIFRLVRAATLQQLQQDYVDVARCRGETSWAILTREIAPNLLPLVAADVGVRLLSAIFIIATASFLGLGASQPQADWGLMIMENRQGLVLQPWATLAPVLAMLLLLIPFNMLLDGLFLNANQNQRRAPIRHATKSSPDSLLQLVDLTLSQGNKVLLNQVNLRIEAGEIVALVGSSASGKSTLLRASLAHWAEDSHFAGGDIWLCGRSLQAMKSSPLRQWRSQHVGYVPQDPRAALVASQRIGSYLTLIGRSRGLNDVEIRHSLQAHFLALGLPEEATFLRRYPHQISGGQRQRVMLAAALLGYPSLLLLDEPTSALDAVNTRSILSYVQRVARGKGMTVLMVAHDLPQASLIADRIVLLEQGQIIEQRPTAEFISAPATPEGKRLVNAGWQTPSPVVSAPLPVLLQARRLSARHGGHPALNNIELQLRHGGCLHIVGSSGGGKTTLLRSLIGLHTPCSGQLMLDGECLNLTGGKRSATQRRKIQYVPQDPWSSLNPFYRVGALIGRPLSFFVPQLPKAERRLAVIRVMEQVGLPAELASRRAQSLSGGQRQRVALARALIVDPDILLCDEVTSALDSHSRREIAALLDRLRRESGLALLIVTHDMRLTAQIGGELAVIDQGSIIEQGAVAQVLAAPQHPLTQALINAAQVETSSLAS